MTVSPQPGKLGSPAASEPEPHGRYRFLIEGRDPGDALLRVLGVVAMQQAEVAAVEFRRTGPGFVAKLQLFGLDPQRAEHLSQRLAQLPVVLSVSFGSPEGR
jgi:hypothetical protein